MAPKGQVKREKVLCVKGSGVQKDSRVTKNSNDTDAYTAKKDAANKFQFKLKAAPAAVREFYDNKLKMLKATSSEEKRKFMEEVTDGDFDSAYFKKLEVITTADKTLETTEWMSWKQVTDLHGKTLVDAMIQQGTMLTRVHKKLDPTHPSFASIPTEETLQYKETQEKEITSSEHTKHVERGCDDVPPETADCTEEESEMKVTLSKVRAARSKVQAATIDIKIKLGKFEGNRLIRGPR